MFSVQLQSENQDSSLGLVSYWLDDGFEFYHKVEF